MTISISELRKKWDLTFNDPLLTVTSLRQKAIQGDICEFGLRGVCWKIFLDYLPSLSTETYPLHLQKEREYYNTLREKFIRSPAREREGDISVNNPLALNDDNPWKEYYTDLELRKIIRQDVERTFPDQEYFRDPNVQDKLTDILFIYCKLNQDVSYRQGMHEVAAPILWVLELEGVQVSEAEGVAMQSDPFMVTLDQSYSEHDAFILFSQVMKSAKVWYEFNEETFGSQRRRVTRQGSSLEETKMLNHNNSALLENARVNPVVMETQKIHHEYLKTVDPELFNHLEELEIEPQLYGIRWLRLMFGREFPFSELLSLWDGIFASDPTLRIVDFVYLAMLIRIREELLQEDYSGCLAHLMHYPSHVPHTFVEQAIYLRDHLTFEGGIHIIRQNDQRAGRIDRTYPSSPPTLNTLYSQFPQPHGKVNSSGSGTPIVGEVPQPGTQDLAKMAGENFARLGRDVMKNSQVREVNRVIAGVAGVVGATVGGVITVADNVLGSQQGRARSSTVGDFPPALSRLPEAQPHNYPSISDITSSKPLPAAPSPSKITLSQNITNPQYISDLEQLRENNNILGGLVERSVSILEKELFGERNGKLTATSQQAVIEQSKYDISTPSIASRSTNDIVSSTDTTNSSSSSDVLPPNDIRILIALAGLKHVRDVLKGTVKELNRNVLEPLAGGDEKVSGEWEVVERDEAVSGAELSSTVTVPSLYGMTTPPQSIVNSRSSNMIAIPSSSMEDPTTANSDTLNEEELHKYRHERSKSPIQPVKKLTLKEMPVLQSRPKPPKSSSMDPVPSIIKSPTLSPSVFTIEDLLSDPQLAVPQSMSRNSIVANDRFSWMISPDISDESHLPKSPSLFDRRALSPSRFPASLRNPRSPTQPMTTNPFETIISRDREDEEKRNGRGNNAMDPLDAKSGGRRVVDEFDV